MWEFHKSILANCQQDKRNKKDIRARLVPQCFSVRTQCVFVCVCVKKSALNSLQKLSQLKVRYVVNLQMMMMEQEPKPKVLTCPAHTAHTKRYTHTNTLAYICIIRMHVLGSSVPKCRFSVPLLNSAFLCIPNESEREKRIANSTISE